MLCAVVLQGRSFLQCSRRLGLVPAVTPRLASFHVRSFFSNTLPVSASCMCTMFSEMALCQNLEHLFAAQRVVLVAHLHICNSEVTRQLVAALLPGALDFRAVCGLMLSRNARGAQVPSKGRCFRRCSHCLGLVTDLANVSQRCMVAASWTTQCALLQPVAFRCLPSWNALQAKRVAKMQVVVRSCAAETLYFAMLSLAWPGLRGSPRLQGFNVLSFFSKTLCLAASCISVHAKSLKGHV